MQDKQCFKCFQVKPLTEFYTHPKTTDGRLGKCKACTREDVKENRSQNRQRFSLYDKQRNLNPDRRKRKFSYEQNHRRKNPEKYKARMMVGNAIRDRRLIPLPCQNCGNPKSQAHHKDYSKPLDVDWLCFKCHREIEHNQIVTVE